ncbi:hypothetical protein ACHHV8_01305 [Paenibacillus sp. TAB 01]|uniref:hypothetical protein n=1 Tax=Paenibacillus sp. TAB 01 TaxID=3368988 RepID=UPI0037525014
MPQPQHPQRQTIGNNAPAQDTRSFTPGFPGGGQGGFPGGSTGFPGGFPGLDRDRAVSLLRRRAQEAFLAANQADFRAVLRADSREASKTRRGLRNLHRRPSYRSSSPLLSSR